MKNMTLGPDGRLKRKGSALDEIRPLLRSGRGELPRIPTLKPPPMAPGGQDAPPLPPLLGMQTPPTLKRANPQDFFAPGMQEQAAAQQQQQSGAPPEAALPQNLFAPPQEAQQNGGQMPAAGERGSFRRGEIPIYTPPPPPPPPKVVLKKQFSEEKLKALKEKYEVAKAKWEKEQEEAAKNGENVKFPTFEESMKEAGKEALITYATSDTTKQLLDGKTFSSRQEELWALEKQLQIYKDDNWFWKNKENIEAIKAQKKEIEKEINDVQTFNAQYELMKQDYMKQNYPHLTAQEAKAITDKTTSVQYQTPKEVADILGKTYNNAIEERAALKVYMDEIKDSQARIAELSGLFNTGEITQEQIEEYTDLNKKMQEKKNDNAVLQSWYNVQQSIEDSASKTPRADEARWNIVVEEDTRSEEEVKVEEAVAEVLETMESEKKEYELHNPGVIDNLITDPYTEGRDPIEYMMRYQLYTQPDHVTKPTTDVINWANEHLTEDQLKELQGMLLEDDEEGARKQLATWKAKWGHAAYLESDQYAEKVAEGQKQEQTSAALTNANVILEEMEKYPYPAEYEEHYGILSDSLGNPQSLICQIELAKVNRRLEENPNDTEAMALRDVLENGFGMDYQLIYEYFPEYDRYESAMASFKDAQLEKVSEDELKKALYLVLEGKYEEAEAYAKQAVIDEKNAKREEKEGKLVDEDTSDLEKAFIRISSGGEAILNTTVGALPQLLVTLKQSFENANNAWYEEDVGVAPNEWMLASREEQNIMTYATEGAEKFAINTVYSIADSLVTVLLFGWAGGVAVGVASGVKAAANRTVDMYYQGANAGQQLFGGLISGVAEGVSSGFSFGRLTKFLETDIVELSVAETLKRIMGSAAQEGLEELTTEAINIAGDIFVMQEKAEIVQFYADFLRENPDKKGLAVATASLYLGGQLLEAFAGGFISGTVMSSAGLGGAAVKTGFNKAFNNNAVLGTNFDADNANTAMLLNNKPDNLRKFPGAVDADVQARLAQGQSVQQGSSANPNLQQNTHTQAQQGGAGQSNAVDMRTEFAQRTQQNQIRQQATQLHGMMVQAEAGGMQQSGNARYFANTQQIAATANQYLQGMPNAGSVQTQRIALSLAGSEYLRSTGVDFDAMTPTQRMAFALELERARAYLNTRESQSMARPAAVGEAATTNPQQAALLAQQAAAPYAQTNQTGNGEGGNGQVETGGTQGLEGSENQGFADSAENGSMDTDELTEKQKLALWDVQVEGQKYTYTNPSGAVINWVKQSPKNFQAIIDANMRKGKIRPGFTFEAKNAQLMLEAQQQGLLPKGVEVEGMSLEMCFADKSDAGDIDLLLTGFIIEEKLSMSSIKEDQIRKMADRLSKDYFNYDNRKVVYLIENPKAGNYKQRELLDLMIEQNITIVSTFEELLKTILEEWKV